MIIDIKSALKIATKKISLLDAEILLGFVLKISQENIFLNPKKKLCGEDYENFIKTVNQRCKVPLAYILNKKEFFGRKFFVDERVLVPRIETEFIVEEILDLNLSEKKILEIGTGSGVIAITLAIETDAKIFACDISRDALMVAKKNAKLLDAKINFFQSDLLENCSNDVQIIVANLPYLRSENIVGLLLSEPKLALDGGKDGLFLYKKLLQKICNNKQMQNLEKMFFEIDPSQIYNFEKIAKQYFPNTEILFKKNNFVAVIKKA